jgi:hypothetical protein
MESRINKYLETIKKYINGIRRIKRNERMYSGQLERLTAEVNRMEKLDALYVAGFKSFQYQMRYSMAELELEQRLHSPSNFEKRGELLKYVGSVDLYTIQLEDEKGVIEAAQEMKGLYARFNEKFLELKVAAEAEKVGSAAISPNVFVEAEKKAFAEAEKAFVEAEKKAFAEAEKAFAAEEEDLLQKAIWQAIDEAYEVYSLQ